MAPEGVTVAVNQPCEIGQVMVFAGFRFAVTESLTREEFQARVERNRERRLREEREMRFQFGDRPGQGSFIANVQAGSSDNDRVADKPTPDQKYFYALKRLPGRSGKA